jgi:hypothetical protein
MKRNAPLIFITSGKLSQMWVDAEMQDILQNADVANFIKSL